MHHKNSSDGIGPCAENLGEHFADRGARRQGLGLFLLKEFSKVSENPPKLMRTPSEESSWKRPRRKQNLSL
jgi:hypothetical protein